MMILLQQWGTIFFTDPSGGKTKVEFSFVYKKNKEGEIKIVLQNIGNNSPTYFIADIASNHDGSLSKAKELIHMAAESGADAAKFQNFYAKTLVSDFGFDEKLYGESFFRKGIKDEWKAELPKSCQQKIINKFLSEMSELGYIN